MIKYTIKGTNAFWGLLTIQSNSNTKKSKANKGLIIPAPNSLASTDETTLLQKYIRNSMPVIKSFRTVMLFLIEMPPFTLRQSPSKQSYIRQTKMLSKSSLTCSEIHRYSKALASWYVTALFPFSQGWPFRSHRSQSAEYLPSRT